MEVDVACDRVLQMVDGMERSASDPAARDGEEKALDGPARMIGEPFENLEPFVGGVVSTMAWMTCPERQPRSVEKADEFFMPVPVHAASDHCAIQEIQRREQRGRAIPLVVMGHRPASACLHRQAWLGAVESLDLALFVDREDDSVLERVQIEADDVLDLLDGSAEQRTMCARRHMFEWAIAKLRSMTMASRR